MRTFIRIWAIALLVSGIQGTVQGQNDVVFLHHSCGSNWLGDGLADALVAKPYIDERNDITYGTDVEPSAGRPDSLDPTPGDATDMNHWLPWFNDYFTAMRAHDCDTGFNHIIMFKSCYPNSNISEDGTEPGDPFDWTKSLANYRAVYRHPAGPGNTYSQNGTTYAPLEDIFAANPDILFIAVTAPSNVPNATTADEAARARTFNNWLKGEWLTSYNNAHPALRNVAVFDWFDVLAYPVGHAEQNTTRAEYRSSDDDSHPNSLANQNTTALFATNPDCFLDGVFSRWTGNLSADAWAVR